MAIVVLCSGCKTRLTLGDDRAGTTFNCPRCDGLIGVPVLLSPTLPPPKVVDFVSEKETEDEPPRLRRKKGSPWLAFIWLGLAGVMVSGFLYWAVSHANQEPEKQTTGEKEEPKKTINVEKRTDATLDWTHKDLVKHLEKKGIKVEVSGGHPGLTQSDRVCTIFFVPKGEEDAVTVEESGVSTRTAVMVYLCKNQRTADEQAGSMGKGSFTFGRFALGANGVVRNQKTDAFLLRLQTALTGPGLIIGTTGIPESWTHKELAEYLENKGLKYKMFSTSRGTLIGPAVFFVVDGTASASDEEKADRAFRDKSPDVIYCQVLKTAQDAKDRAGNLGSEAFSNGRFFYYGQPKALERIRQFLP
jgi:hypothetical protein